MGKFNFRETVREQKIHKLDDELKLIELYKGEADPDAGNEAESYFEAWVKGRHGHQLLRSGWPDYMLMDSKTGLPFCVEVKTDKDRMSRGQERCFAALERGGIKVYVWSPSKPRRLEPWRGYLKRTGRLRNEPRRETGRNRRIRSPRHGAGRGQVDLRHGSNCNPGGVPNAKDSSAAQQKGRIRPMDEQQNKPPVVRDEHGRIVSGAVNPGGRPRAFREYQDWLAENALGPAKDALLACLKDEDGRVRIAAVKEVADRLFGKAPQTILGEDGKPLLAGLGTELVEALRKMVEAK